MRSARWGANTEEQEALACHFGQHAHGHHQPKLQNPPSREVAAIELEPARQRPHSHRRPILARTRPAPWTIVASGAKWVCHPRCRSRKQRSISSLYMKYDASKPPTSSKADLRIASEIG